jgi:hypothetical protein
MTIDRNFEANLHPEKLVCSPSFDFSRPGVFLSSILKRPWFGQDSGRKQALNQVGAFQNQAVEGEPS